MARPQSRTAEARRSRHPDGRRRASHSMESVLTEAVALLDEAGAQALTFRALAQRLGGGVASIYWYVASKEELLDRATDHVIGTVLADIERLPALDDPIDDLRAMALTLFDAIVDRPWLGAYFMRETDVQGNSLRLYEKLGEPTLRLDLTARQRFHAVSAVVGVVVGSAVDLGQEPPQEVLDGAVNREDFLHRYAQAWRELDPAEFPFVHEIVDEFDGHDDVDQFRSALELTLTGLRLQAGTGTGA
jgi:AcrR family transcriptional regulator